MSTSECAVCEMPDADHLDWCTPQARLNAKYDPMSRDDLIAECERLRVRCNWLETYKDACDNETRRARDAEAAERQKRQSVELELDAALAQLQGLCNALDSFVKIADEAATQWDNDNDARVGKMLLAMAGHASRYRADIDAIHALRKGALTRSAPQE